MKKVIYLPLLVLIILFAACKKESMPPVPDFTFTVDSMTVKLTGTSTNNPTSWNWDFGDGESGSGSSVTHTYAKEGSYTVTLKVSNDDGSNTVSSQVNIGAELKLAEISTKFGNMVMWLYDETPNHKSNFLKLTEQGFYDSTTFHRIIENFVIQGGDPNSKDTDVTNDGYGGTGYTIPAEFRSDLTHVYGAVGAARDNNPQKASNGSQFYIVVNKSGDHNLDGDYTVFGQILSGMDVAEKIAVQPKDIHDRPLSDIRMSVKIIQMTRTAIKDTYGFDVK
jgi:cyclophilin family peptidyl-prolyl cis-trans isomerase